MEECYIVFKSTILKNGREVKVLPADKKTSLPAPVSPNNNTGASVGAAICANVIA